MTRPHMSPETVLSPLGCQLRDWNVSTRVPPRSGHRRGLIVDLDDTLYPHEAFVHSGLMAVARHVEETSGVTAMDAFAVMTAARRERGGQELQALCAHCGWPEDLVAELLAVYRGHLPNLHLPRASAEALTQLRRDRWRIVVLTNGLPLVQRAKVRALGIGPLVDAVIYAEEHATGGKPAAAAFRAALNALDLPASHCVCVGDDIVCDVAGAKAHGIRTIWFNAGAAWGNPGPADRHAESGPHTGAVAADLCIGSIGELPPLLAEWNMVNSDAA